MKTKTDAEIFIEGCKIGIKEERQRILEIIKNANLCCVHNEGDYPEPCRVINEKLIEKIKEIENEN